MKKIWGELLKDIKNFYFIIMIVFLTLSFIFGVSVVKIERLLQVLLISVVIGGLNLLLTSKRTAKKLSTIVRFLIFTSSVFVLTCISVVLFRWFPIDNVYMWLILCGIFAVCIIVSLIIYAVEYKVKGKEYTERLYRYRDDSENKNTPQT